MRSVESSGKGAEEGLDKLIALEKTKPSLAIVLFCKKVPQAPETWMYFVISMFRTTWNVSL